MVEKKLIVIGAGQTIDEIFPIIKNLKSNINYKLFKILDDDKKFYKKSYKGIPIEIGISKAKKYKNCHFIFGIGSYKNKNNREKILKKVTKHKEVIKKYKGEESVQDFVEKKINHFLNACCDYESKKKYAASKIYHDLYLLRNYIFKINPSSERKIIPSFYQDNIESLKEIIKFSKENNIKLYFYIAPIRSDIKLPYNINEYNNFLDYSKQVSDTNNVNFKSFEKIIPNNLWGTKPGTSVDRKVEVDFMHFQGPAHKILSTNIYNFLKTNDF